MRAFQALREQDVQKPAGLRAHGASPTNWQDFLMAEGVCVGEGMGLDQQAW